MPEATRSEQPEPQLDRRSGDMAGVVQRNIRALLEVRRKLEGRRRPDEKAADVVTSFAGSMRSVLVHGLLFGGWILVNLGVIPGIEPFDPFPFVMLAMWASVEAIFLSTFVLISQNRMSALAEKRAELDLQVNLLAEHEITRLITLVEAIAKHLDLDVARDPYLEELKSDVAPETVLAEMEEAEQRIAMKRND